MSIRDAQDIVHIQLRHELQGLDTFQREAANFKPGSKEIYRHAQSVKWAARRIARLAQAIEVLESCDPRYGHDR